VGGTGKGVEAIEPGFLWIDHCEIDGAANGIYVLCYPTDPTETKAQITINFTRADPLLATANAEIAYNQVIHCITTDIALAYGVAQDGTPYQWAWLGICIEGRGQPESWLEWLQLRDNVVGCNDHTGTRTDLFLWFPNQSDAYCQGNTGLHDGPITLADERAQWQAWESKLAANGVKVGP
jgi:hypothetical protein